MLGPPVHFEEKWLIVACTRSYSLSICVSVNENSFDISEYCTGFFFSFFLSFIFSFMCLDALLLNAHTFRIVMFLDELILFIIVKCLSFPLTYNDPYSEVYFNINIHNPVFFLNQYLHGVCFPTLLLYAFFFSVSCNRIQIDLFINMLWFKYTTLNQSLFIYLCYMLYAFFLLSCFICLFFAINICFLLLLGFRLHLFYSH